MFDVIYSLLSNFQANEIQVNLILLRLILNDKFTVKQQTRFLKKVYEIFIQSEQWLGSLDKPPHTADSERLADWVLKT